MKLTKLLTVSIIGSMLIAGSANARSYENYSKTLQDVFYNTQDCLVLNRVSGFEYVGTQYKELGKSDKVDYMNFHTGQRAVVNVSKDEANISTFSNADYNFSESTITYSTPVTDLVTLRAVDHKVFKSWSYYTNKGTRVWGISINEAVVDNCNKHF